METDKIKKEAAEVIISAVKFSVGCETVANSLGVELSASIHLNIRDAMFHYRKLCSYAPEEEKNILKHYYNLKEHIIRGEKDAIVLLAGNVVDALSELSQQTCFQEFTFMEVKQFQKNSHEIRNIVLRIRTDGIDPDSPEGFPFDIFSELTVYIKNIVKICENRRISLF